MLIFPYFLLGVMGIVVGLVGGGGAILTVPILVYFFHIDPIIATFYSLVIVGMTALVGAILKIGSGEIIWKVGIIFGVPSIIATFFSRHTLVPSIPDHVFLIEKGTFLLLIFGLIMFMAGCSMVCRRKSKKMGTPSLKNWKKGLLTALEGGVVGTITGLVGAGGGFLIVPALMMLEGLDIRKAVSTSLLIIALKSLIGSLGDISNSLAGIDISFLIYGIVIAIIGLFVGIFLQKKIPAEKLSWGFGIFTMIMSVVMLSRELFF